MKKGFTVVEVLITVVVFAVLLGLTVPKFITLVHKAREGSTKHQLVRLRSAIAAYYGENQGTYPTDDLSSLVPRYIEAIPKVNVPGLDATNKVTTGTYEQAFDKSGGRSSKRPCLRSMLSVSICQNALPLFFLPYLAIISKASAFFPS